MGHREHPDTRALGRIGCCVRGRLAKQSTLARLDSRDIELWHAEAYVEPHACARLIALIDTVAAPSLLAQEDGWAGYRTSCSADIPPADRDVRALEQRLTDLTGIDAACGENLQGQRYAPGEYYHTHCDWFDTAAPYWEQERRCGGQRSWTAMVYLNDVDGGGETHFPALGLRVRPRTGTLLVWNNARPDGTPNPATRHAALAVQQGTKYILTKWFRARAWML